MGDTDVRAAFANRAADNPYSTRSEQLDRVFNDVLGDGSVSDAELASARAMLREVSARSRARIEEGQAQIESVRRGDDTACVL